jgi:glutamine synthetase
MRLPPTGEPPEAAGFLAEHPEIEAIDLLLCDINGIFRGKRIEREALARLYVDGVCLPRSAFVGDITGNVVEETGLGVQSGDVDHVCRPVAGTLKPTGWHQRPTAQVLLQMTDEHGGPVPADPRHVLARVLERYEALGLVAVVALELEFYFIDRELGEDHRVQTLVSPVTGQRESQPQVYSLMRLDDHEALLADVAETCRLQGVPAHAAVAEYAPGQFEINLKHQRDAMRACDHALLLKRLIKGVAARHGVEATFMPKPHPAMSGSGMHVHVSLVDRDGRNVFAVDGGANDALRHAVGGALAAMRESCLIFAPHANSYRRLEHGSYAPTSATWGLNNRTTAIRIPMGPPDACRIEHRVGGADANPFLIVAAVLAAMHRGLVERVEPPPPSDGNAYDLDAPRLPRSWHRAIELFGESELLPGYFGAEFCRILSVIKEHEYAVFNREVTPLEYDWYLRNL